MRLIALDRYPVGLPLREEWERRERPKPASARVRLGAKRFVYDVRRRRYLGELSEIRAAVAVHEPRIFACLPYRVEGLSLDAPAAARPGDVVPLRLAIETSGKPLAPHVVTVDVYGPKGEWRSYHRRRVLMKAREASAIMGLAHNAAPGTWRIRATDVATGASTERPLRVAAR